MHRLALLVFLVFCCWFNTHAQDKSPVIGITPTSGARLEFLDEVSYYQQHFLRLADAIPPEKYNWRPSEGTRTIGEVYMHIALANFYLLSVTGPKMPADLNGEMEKTVTSKAEVIAWLKRSLEAVKTAHQNGEPQSLRLQFPFE